MTDSSRSTQRSQKRARTGIAASSAIALALGGLSVVGPGPLAPYAAAATLSGGIRDKSGAVEKDAQKASDLPAGSCTVSENSQQGSQAGFSWYASEPAADSPSKTRWGLSVAFDNSQDRTFADWGFTNSGLMGRYLDAGQIPAMNAGQTLVDKVVTHKADEILGITASKQQRNLNLAAKLTDAKVKQFAEATAANPVRYAWQGDYTQENPDPKTRATRGESAGFTAIVNPWPSENIECNPITVSWENFEKHVIVPGDETKVGKINIPDVTGDGTDDSMSRMVVEAYDGNGKFIGTTDPEASGGTQNLRIDETTGEIYFTWPEYRGTDLATDKNVNFSVLAKPRSVDQLKAAAKNNNEYLEHDGAFDSSNSLDRYSKANVIDSKAFSLDDTEYHAPKYDKTDASIISGVDSATGPLATEPQKVVFKQVPDLIANLAKKKGDGGFEAKVELDEKYVYEGWTVDIDEDYNVTVTAPENPKPGSFAQPKITVEYSNGSTDVLQLLVVVDPNNTQVTDLVRPGLSKGKLNEEITAQVGTKSIMKGHKPVHPAKFEIDESTVPDGWTVTVDDTGKVTAKADDSVAPGTIITPKVKATYPDQTTDEIETQFQAIVDIKIPTYDTKTGQPNASVSLTPEIPERGLSGNTTDEAPTRYTFEDGTNQTTLTSKDGKTWTVNVDENTGEITTTIPKGAQEGDILNVPVQAHYSDEGKQKPQTVVGTVVVIKGDLKASYDVQVTGPGQATEHQVEDTPDGSTFSFGQKNGKPVLTQKVDGWNYTIDPKTGVVTATPPTDAKPGERKTVSVTVNAPGGLTTQAPVTTVVKLTNAWEAEPTYPVETVFPGDTAELAVNLDKPDDVNVAKDTPYKLGKVPTGWTVSIDSNGKIIATAPEDAEQGTQVEIPVTVTYEDGSTDQVKAVINVVDVPTREVPYKVVYKQDDSIPAGEYEVETKGKPGKEKQNRDGTWERTEEPVDEVVLVGTKPVVATGTQTWIAPTPYDTVLRPNPDLKPGETKIVREGTPGKTQYTVDFSAKDGQTETTPTKTELEPPVDQIIEYGPQLNDDELVVTTKKPVVFETKIIFDDTLVAGRTITDEEGETGEITVTSTQKLVDGRPSGDPVVTEEVTKEKKDAVVRVGTMTEGEITNKYEVDVPYTVEIVYDDSIPAGETKVKQEGVPGKKTTTVTQKIRNSQPDGDPEMTFDETKAPVTKIILVGTKQAKSKSDVTWTEPIPYPTELRPADDLAPGETRVVQEGEDGEVTYTAKFTAAGGEAGVDEGEVRKPAKPRIVEYGLQTDSDDYVVETTRHIPFETKVVFDETLQEGEQVIEQGVVGQEAITATQKIVNGRPTGDPVITTRTIQEPKNAVIRIGVKPTPDIVDKIKVPIPFKTKVEYDPEMPAGTSETVTEGKLGEKEITTTRKVTDGVPGDPEVTEKVISKPVNQVIKVGTKPSSASNKVTWTAQVPFEVETRPNPELKPGEIKVAQKGVAGEKTYTADFSATGNDATVTPEEKQTKAPVNEIIEYGPALDADELVTTVKKPVPFETEIVFDDTLEEGKQVVKQQGELGEDTVTSTQKLVDGKPSGDPVVTTERTKEPKKAIIRVGTKKKTEDPTPPIEAKIIELPFTTEIIYDENLEPGTEVVDREGKNGEVEVTVDKGQPSVETIKEPVSKIIRVGTKPADGQEWKERIPFEVKVELDPELEAGKHEVKREGEPGLVQHKSDGTEETLVEKQDHIIRIGTKPVEPADPEDPEQPEVPDEGIEIEVRYTTRIVYDPNLKPGEEVEDVAGKDGKYRIKVVDGKPVAELVEKPVERVLRVGTKPTTGSWSEEIAYEHKVEHDPNLPEGEVKVEGGKPGERIHREDGSVVEIAAQDLVVKIGTGKKPADPDNKKGSSEKAERCVANAFATNSPLLWMLPIGLLAGIGYGVNEAFGPQIQAASAQINARFQESMPKHDWGFGDQGQRRQDPEWMRELQAQADGINRQFAGYSEQLQPLGIALGVIASLALLGSLIAQACTEEGFDNGMTVWGLKGGSSEPGKRPKEWSSQN